MNGRLSALLLPLALAGCATFSRTSADEGLRARLGRDAGALRVALSEPAHVAVFEVVPGKGVELLYPAVESDPSLLPAGRTTLESDGRRIHAYRRAVYGRRAPVLYMIASRHPLDETLIRDMRQEWGVLSSDFFLSDDPGEIMERLASLMVSADRPQPDWATDALSTRRPGSRRYASSGSGREPGDLRPHVYCGAGRSQPTSSSGEICP
jgi:hypothetical protein